MKREMKSQLQMKILLENKKSNYKISKLKNKCNLILFISNLILFKSNLILFKSNYDVINQEDSLTFYQISI